MKIFMKILWIVLCIILLNPILTKATDLFHLMLPAEVKTQQQTILNLKLLQPKASGEFSSVVLRWLEKPVNSNPQVVLGEPETKLTFDLPGLYAFEIELTLLSKGSCAGVKIGANQIHTTQITVR